MLNNPRLGPLVLPYLGLTVQSHVRPTLPAFELPAAIQRLLARSIEDCRAERSRPAVGEQTTHAALLLDESWSMNRHRAAALAGYNHQVGVIKEGAKEAGKTLVTLNVFSSTPREVLSAAPTEQLSPLPEEEYTPTGGTALYDAIGDTIASLLARPDADSPSTAFLVAPFTDGEDTSSYRYPPQLLRELVAKLEATGRWTFTLVGPTGQVDEFAAALNLQAGNIKAYDATKTESVTSAFTEMAGASTRYMAMRSAGVMASASLYAGR
ncbi:MULTISPECIES: vWA domain-containing protein [unclassified Variovorax]|uniref:vWA domain-containing protein n=1 Tax=unclassified Variovorax TaxID=663243 RepID=UPI001318993F|nr:MULTISPECIES: vWA domain-containing protein [unclassified Variovorax]VTU42298.1 hypothetical protein H6P1_00151 [Variovorax sp. PBL-H6]VTU44082.1 hypothetical protein SRS16P1_00751 [Variovorax sp. SRS16]VTU44164.1 hypothetical protein E5P1_00744 [Variovorax sp. PBL-E5]